MQQTSSPHTDTLTEVAEHIQVNVKAIKHSGLTELYQHRRTPACFTVN